MISDPIKYTVRYSKGLRSLRIAVHRNGDVIVSVSPLIPKIFIERVLAKKKDWILKKREEFLKHPINPFSELLRKHGRKEYLENKDKAQKILTDRVGHFNKQYLFEYRRISIRNQRSRWGSCSKKGNLSFNYKLILLPDNLRDYVVVHEICHLKELNHSKRFWDLVEKAIPNYRQIRNELKGIG